MRHLQDEIRITFTKYALIPVFIIALICVVLAFTYWNKNVLESNAESRQLVAEVIEGIVTDYKEQANDIADAGYDLTALAASREQQMKLYTKLYKQVNIMHDNTSFYLLNAQKQVILSNRALLPRELQMIAGAKWGIFHRMELLPHETLMEFGTNDRFYERDMIIARALEIKGTLQGYIVFVIPGTYLRQAISSPHVQFVIADEYDYTPIATDSGFSDVRFQKLWPSLKGAAGSISFKDQHYYVSESSILSGKLRVYAFSPIGNMITQYLTGAGILLGVLLIMIPIIIVSVRRETARKMQTIDELVEAFAAVKNGELDRQITVRPGNEFEPIAAGYNRMVRSLHRLIDLNKEKVRATVVSEVKQLESQFNPHFLFNTLENIKFMVKLDPEAATRMIVALSALLRYSINNEVQRVTVQADLDYTQHYIDIQKYRFGSRLVYNQEVDAAAKLCRIPKLLLQPIIENAMKYGADSEGNIQIKTQITIGEDMLSLSIQDHGPGINKKNLHELQAMLNKGGNETMHMGIYNIHRRIQLLYGTSYGLKITSREGQGTCIEILLPIDIEGTYKEM